MGIMLVKKKWISIEIFENIEPGDKLVTRFMGKAKAVTLPENGEIIVKFTSGPWKDRELMLIRHQIAQAL